MRTPETAAIFASELTKRFRPELPPPVDRLNFEIRPGESVAFLGPNGAGKSTTIISAGTRSSMRSGIR